MALEKLPRLLFKEVKRGVGPDVWNYGVRPSLAVAADTTQFAIMRVAVPSLATAKGTVEYGLKLGLYLPKVAVRGVIELENLRRARQGVAPIANSRFYPRIGLENIFKYGEGPNAIRPGGVTDNGNLAVDANGNALPALPTRPGFMNWAWNNRAEQGRIGRMLGMPDGNFRGAQWPWAHSLVLKKLEYVRPEDRPSKLLDENGNFDSSKLDKFAKPLSDREYHAYRNWLCQVVRNDWASRWNKAVAPRVDAAGTHYISTDGKICLPRNIGIDGVNNVNGINDPPDASNIIAYINYYNDNDPDANILVPAAGGEALKAASTYYPDPELWMDLKAVTTDDNGAVVVDKDRRKKAIVSMVEQAKMKVKQQHYKMNERIKQRALDSLLKELQDEMDLCETEEDWLKFVDTFQKRTFGIDDLGMGWLKELPDGLIA